MTGPRVDDGGAPPAWRVVTRPCRHGNLSFLPADDPIGRSLDEYGEWAEAEIAFLLRLIGPGDVVLDVGANVGTHTVAFAKHVGASGKVYAFEPQPMIFSLLRANVGRNGLANVECVNAGVADARGEMLVPALDYGERFNFGAVALRPLEPGAPARGAKVPVLPLDECAAGRPALIKLDVEGMEPRVLRGGRRTLSTARPIVYVECNAIEPGWAAVQLMRELGYEALLHQTAAYNPSNLRANRANFFGDAHESSLLFVPAERAAAVRRTAADAPLLTPIGSLDDLARTLLETRRWSAEGTTDPSPLVLASSVRQLRAALAATLAERDRQVAALEDALAARERHVAAILDSVSWRVTRPLRAAKAVAVRAATTSRRLAASAGAVLCDALPAGTPGGVRLRALVAREPRPDRPLGSARPVPGGPSDPGAWPKADRPESPSAEAWARLIERRRAAGPAKAAPLVDVVIPVYRGLAETLACVYSVLDADPATPHEVVVIDDAGPEPDLAAELERLAGEGLFTLARNATNLGFVRTANLGIGLHPERDVVLLNSDTEVYGDWLDRLRAAAYSRPNAGTVTPLSNNAEIFSYPIFARDNDMRLEVGYDDLDAMAARVNVGLTVDVPTAVGFCMYVRRDCIRETGLLDAERFGRGYGEENDFCLRASARGWRHLLAGDVFVRHCGGVSFGDEKAGRIRQGLKVLLRSFPDYTSRIQDFLARDPVHPIRRRLDVARLTARASRRAVLFVTHRRGGGTERHVDDLRHRLALEEVSVFFLRPVPGRPRLVALEHPEVPATANVGPFDLDADLDALTETLAEIGIEHVHVHSLVDLDPAAPEWIRTLSARLGVPYDFTAHDYACVCPRITLIGRSGVYCGEPDVETCQTCVSKAGSPFGDVPVAEWRARYASLLGGARRVFVPSADVEGRLHRYFPDVLFALRPHPESAAARIAGAAVRRPGEPLRVAVIGAIGPHKGSGLLVACARDALARKLPIDFVVFGYTDEPKALARLRNVTVTGPYDEAALPSLLERQPCHLALFASVIPETYSYTLSIAFRAGLFPVAFDLGAIAERIRAAAWGALLPLSLMAEPAEVNDRLLSLSVAPAPDRPPVEPGQARYPSCGRDYYGW